MLWFQKQNKYITVMLMVIVLLVLSVSTATATQPLTVNAYLLNVRSGPSINNSIITTIPRHTILTSIESTNGWVKVALQNGSKGWVASRFTSPLSIQNYATVNVPILNLRSGSSTNFSIIGRLPRGEELAIIGQNNGWLRVVRNNGTSGWISGNYVSQRNSRDNSSLSPVQPVNNPTSTVNSHDTYLNDYVQEIIQTYNGNFPYLLNNDYANYSGVTQNIFFKGRQLAKAHPSGNRASHCSGITFEVFFRAMQERNRRLGLDIEDFNGMNYNDLFDFYLTWYVAKGSKRVSNIEVAVEKYGIGERVRGFENAKPGDFIDISRSNGTGHTAIFQNWVRNNNGNIIGLRYWSSQGSTNGIAFNTEYFDSSGRGNVLSNQVYIARVLPVHQYKSFR